MRPVRLLAFAFWVMLLGMALGCGGGASPATQAPAQEIIPPTSPSALPSAAPAPTPRVEPPVGSKVGNLAPDFSLALSTGSSVNLASLHQQGRPVVLYFFTTW